jgi:hypothetical protein
MSPPRSSPRSCSLRRRHRSRESCPRDRPASNSARHPCRIGRTTGSAPMQLRSCAGRLPARSIALPIAGDSDRPAMSRSDRSGLWHRKHQWGCGRPRPRRGDPADSKAQNHHQERRGSKRDQKECSAASHPDNRVSRVAEAGVVAVDRLHLCPSVLSCCLIPLSRSLPVLPPTITFRIGSPYSV